MCDFSIQTEAKIDHNKPDILLLDKKKKTCFIIDVACPFDTWIGKKEREKVEYYTDLKFEILKCRKGEVKKVLTRRPLGVNSGYLGLCM